MIASNEPGRELGIWVPSELHPEATERLRQSGHPIFLGYGPEATTLEAVADRVAGAVVRYHGMSADEIRSATHLAVISRAGVGYENIAVDEARLRGIPVYITAGSNARSVAEHVFALLLALSRRTIYWDSLARSLPEDLDHQRERNLSHTLFGKRLGIVGAGRTAQETVRIGRDGFGMEILVYHPRRRHGEGALVDVQFTADLSELLASSDAVIIEAPLTDETRGMFGAPQFAQMKSTAFLVNVARGEIVDHHALAAALELGEIAGAGIDVWHDKLPTAGDPLVTLEQVVISPHRAGRTEEAQSTQGLWAVDAVLDVLAGRAPQHVVEVAGTGTAVPSQKSPVAIDAGGPR